MQPIEPAWQAHLIDAHCARALLTDVIAERGVQPEFASGPTRLEGGKSADLFTFRLRTGPHDITGPELVLRIPARRDSLVECVVQASLAELGFATPPALPFGRHADHGAFLVMPRVPGSTLFKALGPRRSLREVPARLADLLVDLHDLDPEEIREALQLESGWRLLDRTLADIEAAAHRSAPFPPGRPRRRRRQLGSQRTLRNTHRAEHRQNNHPAPNVGGRQGAVTPRSFKWRSSGGCQRVGRSRLGAGR